MPVIAGGARDGPQRASIRSGRSNIQTDDKPAAGAVADEFHGRPRQARHPAPQQHRHHRHAPVADHRRRRPRTWRSAPTRTCFLLRNVTANAYYARTDSPGRTRRPGQLPRPLRVRRRPLRAGPGEHLLIGAGFQPGGRLRAPHRFPPQLRTVPLQPAPEEQPARAQIQLHRQHTTTSPTPRSTSLQEKELRGTFNTEYQNGDTLNLRLHAQLRARRSQLRRSIPARSVPAGGYNYQNLRDAVLARPAAEGVGPGVRSPTARFYDGHEDRSGLQRAGSAIIPQFALEPSVSLNWVRLPYGDFAAPVISIADHLHAQPANGAEQLHPVQRQLAHAQLERPPAVGVPRRQRDLRRLQRRPAAR